jgi:hypothetical protein
LSGNPTTIHLTGVKKQPAGSEILPYVQICQGKYQELRLGFFPSYIPRKISSNGIKTSDY